MSRSLIIACLQYEDGANMALILEAMKQNFSPINSGYLKKCIEFPDHFTKQLTNQITLVKRAGQEHLDSEKSDL
jgi:hypothetical protein